MQLMPLVIRYCFKIAMFYEFQWKHEKSLKFMSEAYRHVLRYYQYLLARQDKFADEKEEQSASNVPSLSLPRTHSTVADAEGGVEVALHDMNSTSQDHDDSMWSSIIAPPPDDMIQQCRAIAEWLNLKLLLAGFGSHTEGGALAAADQWRQHSRVFCARRHHSTTALLAGQEWFDWAYIARQRLVMSQIVERHPPKALGNLGNEYDEILMRCSPWRTCQAAAESILRLAVEMDKAEAKSLDHSKRSEPMRARYIGSLDSEEVSQCLEEESRVAHRGKSFVSCADKGLVSLPVKYSNPSSSFGLQQKHLSWCFGRYPSLSMNWKGRNVDFMLRTHLGKALLVEQVPGCIIWQEVFCSE
jgi:hypothetical protein